VADPKGAPAVPEALQRVAEAMPPRIACQKCGGMNGRGVTFYYAHGSEGRWVCPQCLDAAEQALAAAQAEREVHGKTCDPDNCECNRRGLSSVLTIRCSKHYPVPQQNKTEQGGGECGGCIAAERDRLGALAREAHEAVRVYLEYWAGEHEISDCPMDDTCECPMLCRMNSALMALNGALK